jgi:predicted RNA-binding protein with PUA-like domain
MQYWLLKSEPSVFGIDDLARRAGKRDSWTGVRNFQARNFLRAMKRGDLAFFYHSSAKDTGIAGIVEVVREAYADPTALDSKSEYFEPKSTADNPLWYTVDVKLERKLHRLITLSELKEQSSLSGMRLLRRGNRLSVMPVEKQHWDAILRLE